MLSGATIVVGYSCNSFPPERMKIVTDQSSLALSARWCDAAQ
jgi:hypothetical protein